MLRTTLLPAFASGIMILTITAPTRAQSQWLGPVQGRAFWVEMIRPDLDDATLATSAWQAGFRAPVGSSMAVVGEVPFAHGADKDFDAEDTTTIGNPYFGIEHTSANGRVTTELGLRAPLVSEENLGTFVGLVSDFIDRAEAFVPNYVPITAAIGYLGPADRGLAVRVRGGGSVWIPTEGGDVEALVLYGIQGWHARRWLAGFGLTGRYIATGGELGVGQRFHHQVGGTLGYGFGSVRPVVEVRVPLDEDLREEMPYVIGIGLTIQQ